MYLICYRNLLFCLILLFSSVFIFSQPVRQNLAGTVIDKKTGAPLQGVNVFLANTMMGDATDVEGNFTIRNVPGGQFEIVVSMIGYDVYSRRLRVTSPMGTALLFKLNPHVLQGETIVINADAQKGWHRNLKIFQKCLLGTTENARKSTIENPYVLDFHKNERSEFTATASAPLIITNKGLGYRIEYVLHFFSAKGQHTKYAGNPRFTRLQPASSKEERKWYKRRKKAYQGSTRHFFSELIRAAQQIRSLSETEIEKLLRKYKINRQRNKNLLALLQQLLTRDYLKKSGFRISFPGGNKSLAVDFRPKKVPVNLAEVISPSDSENEFWLKLAKPLNVRFDREREDSNYLHDMGIEYRWTGPQGSIIESGADSVLIEKFGRYWDIFQLHILGYMGWERLAESLPYEYRPDEEN